MRLPQKSRTEILKTALKKGLKILSFDIETSHMLVRTFYIGHRVHLTHNSIKLPSKVISIQYKWAHEKKSKYLLWNKISTKFHDTRDFDDSSMIQEFITNIYNKAEIVLGQNTDRFDILTLNERAKQLNLSCLLNKPSIDVLKLSRQSFKCASHKLDFRSQQQGFGGKIKMIDEDWVDIEENSGSPTKKMIPYGLKDVEDVEKLFWRELPYYKNLPAMCEKEILKYYTEVLISKIPYCINCHKTRQAKFNITKIKNNIFTCKNCAMTYNWVKE